MSSPTQFHYYQTGLKVRCIRSGAAAPQGFVALPTQDFQASARWIDFVHVPEEGAPIEIRVPVSQIKMLMVTHGTDEAKTVFSISVSPSDGQITIYYPRDSLAEIIQKLKVPNGYAPDLGLDRLAGEANPVPACI